MGLQSTFVFAKPHANTPAVCQTIRDKFAAMEIGILKEGEIAGPIIDEKKLIDQHYYAIASKATILKPIDLNVPIDKFKEAFGEDWNDVKKQGRTLNALDAKDKLQCDEATLDAMWGKAKKDGKLVKFGGGFYCGYLAEHDLYVFNAFFMSMRGKFTAKQTSIHYFVVVWDSDTLSWADFRGNVLGPTDPADAPVDSLRGGILAKWSKLGLKEKPNTGDNCVHASASPFEGFAERTNWLRDSYTAECDSFGRLLLAAGISLETLKAWSVDPQVLIPFGGGMKGSLFDQLEDLDVEACVAKCVEIHRAQDSNPLVALSCGLLGI